jgi:hypothetical protein
MPTETTTKPPTPGPWIYIGEELRGGKYWSVIHRRGEGDSPYIVDGIHEDDNGEANARLIAAAPDLAEALAAIVHTFHARPDMLALCGFHEHDQIEAACHALNKAGMRNV